ncbi:MAG TPA: mechanosensitive ion channel family protein [Prolixibacteraceae bacterium]|nr:mechanosensitive ion channel family protein [Prolixibacteraceae bacterium]
MTELNLIKAIETIVVILILLGANLFTRNVVKNILKHFAFEFQRRKIAMKLINILLFILAVVVIAAIWGVNQSQLIVFISSFLTVLGIAFFAQWSLLANVTAGLILFLNHPLRLGDRIRIMDKDYNIEGRVDDITYFFLHIRMDNGEKITIPNSIVLQKTISIMAKPENQVKPLK